MYNIIVVASGHSCVVVVVDGLVSVLELVCLCFERGDLGIVYECDFDLQKDKKIVSGLLGLRCNCASTHLTQAQAHTHTHTHSCIPYPSVQLGFSVFAIIALPLPFTNI